MDKILLGQSLKYQTKVRKVLGINLKAAFPVRSIREF